MTQCRQVVGSLPMAQPGSQAMSAFAPLLGEKRTSVGQVLNEYTNDRRMLNSAGSIAVAIDGVLMALIFFERIGHEGRRPSPFSWRIRYALAHKGVDFEVRPVRFADVGIIRALTGQHLTPVLSDGDRAVHETWDIACYLEERFPQSFVVRRGRGTWDGTAHQQLVGHRTGFAFAPRDLWRFSSRS
jgi:hypothetical protein